MKSTEKVNILTRVIRYIDQRIVGFIFHWHLYRTLTLEFIPYFVGGIAIVLIFMGSNAILFNMLDNIVSKHVPPMVYLKVLLLQGPTFLVMGLPMATIFGALMSFGRMAKDNELDAMRTSRVVAWRMLLFMVIVIGAPITAGDWYLTHSVVPRAARQSLDIWKKYIFAEITGRPMANVFFRGERGYNLFVTSFDPGTGWLNGITIYQTTPGKQFPQVIFAPYARWDDQYVTLHKARIYEVKNDGTLSYDATVGEMRINVQKQMQEIADSVDDNIHAGVNNPSDPTKIAKPDLMKTRSLETDLMFNLSMNLDDAELRRQIKIYKDFGLDARSLETNLNFKKSIPFACLVCIVLAVPISVGGARAGRGTMTNLVIILVLMTCYYISTIVAIALGHAGSLPPPYAAWLQNAVFGGIGVALSLFYMRK